MEIIHIEAVKPVNLSSFLAWCTPEFYEAMVRTNLYSRPIVELKPVPRHGPRNRWGALN